MLEILEIRGGVPLRGTVEIQGAKNAALPLMIASLLTSETVQIERIPNLEDIAILIHLLESFGANITRIGSGVSIKVPQLLATETSYSLVKALRASFWVLAPLLARGGAARVALPGGDVIGVRPVDLHLQGLREMGAEIAVRHGTVYATAPNGLKPANISLRFPSVGATHQIVMAASLTKGTTVLSGAAREPEVVALCNMLIQMGAAIEGVGTDRLAITGSSQLGSAQVSLPGDRIEAGTYLLSALASGGDITAKGICPQYFQVFLDVLANCGAGVDVGDDWVRVRSASKYSPVNIVTAPFPGFPTDLQAPLSAFLCLANGQSKIEEAIFEGRFAHVAELLRMGAKMNVSERSIIIDGPIQLSGAHVEGHDIRAAAALVVAAVAAQGTTVIHETQHIHRGYEKLEQKLSGLGAIVGRKTIDHDDYLFAGC